MGLNKSDRAEVVKQANAEGYQTNSNGDLQKGTSILHFSSTQQSIKSNDGQSWNSSYDFKNRKKK
ncbi:hypothetical protein [Dawidia soli]|uniref:Uncharacterized protein n=1 Tax=Dawidia soli TaxID=2782352 RepID=A0AAP2DD75_9BACT|nr:hypothetical protein [Dawidia soli]MBT1689879.1 hypothetical protein [Dawidia soli]